MTEASVPYLSQAKLLDIIRPHERRCATFLVQTGSHPGIASHMVEVQVTNPKYVCDSKEFVEKLIELMQERASNTGVMRGIDGVCLRALLGLALDQSSSVVLTCNLHERHYEDE